MMFPTIEHIDDVWPHVKDKPEFIRIDREHYTAIDYVIQTPDSFKTALQRECRGIKFYPDGRIMARPFHKFFNLGERADPSTVDLSKPHFLQDKVDGSMIHPAILEDEDRLVFMTKKGNTEVAKKAEKYFLGDHRYTSFMEGMLLQGKTPIFEFTGPSQRIVLNYGKRHRLTLLAVRDTITGEYTEYDMLSSMGLLNNISFAEKANHFNYHSGEDLHKTISGMEGIEGYVLTFDDGEKLKIKTEEYVIMHRALDDLSSKKKVTNLILTGFADDVKPILSDEDRKELEEYEDALFLHVDYIAGIVKTHAEAYRCFDTRKNWAVNYVQKMVPEFWRGCVYNVHDCKDPRMVVISTLLKNIDKIPVKWRGE
jgi:RNA ligase